jgi:hypothetical protein
MRVKTRRVRRNKTVRAQRGGRPLLFAVMAIFKNESMILKEWIEHYKWQGVDKILLLNNGSTDNWQSQIPKDADVTVLDAVKPHVQREHYNTLGRPWLKAHGVDILLILDMDEFMFSTDGRTLGEHVKKIFSTPNHPSQISCQWTMFGSSGFDRQPKSVRESFVWAKKNKHPNVKSIMLLKDVAHNGLDLHTSVVVGRTVECPPNIQLNHYAIQSKQFFTEVKMSRGAADMKENVRNMEYFHRYDYKDIKDTKLRDLLTVQRGGSAGRTLVFYHIYCNKHTENIVRGQIVNIVFSGLYKRVDIVNCFLVGEPNYIHKVEQLLNISGKKFKIVAKGPNDKTYERFTLLKMRDPANSFIHSTDKLLYIHSKGVSKDNDENIFWWKTYMEYFLMVKADECLKLLDTHDIVGVHWTHNASYENYIVPDHYSGNFWWSTGSYYMSLPPTIGNRYTDPESYITQMKPKHYVLDSHVNKPGHNFYNVKMTPAFYADS